MPYCFQLAPKGQEQTAPILQDMDGTLKQMHTRLFESTNHLYNIRYDRSLAAERQPEAMQAHRAAQAAFD